MQTLLHSTGLAKTCSSDYTSLGPLPTGALLRAESAHGEHKGSTAELEASRASHASERCKHESSRHAMGSRAAGIGQLRPRECLSGVAAPSPSRSPGARGREEKSNRRGSSAGVAVELPEPTGDMW